MIDNVFKLIKFISIAAIKRYYKIFSAQKKWSFYIDILSTYFISYFTYSFFSNLNHFKLFD